MRPYGEGMPKHLTVVAVAKLRGVSQRRTKDYGDEDWARIQQESAAIRSRVAEAAANGLRPDSDDGVALAEAYRLHIDR